MIKIKKKVPLIDQHDKNGFWGNKFGGNFIPETLKKPVEDLEILFSKLRNDKSFIRERDRAVTATTNLNLKVVFIPVALNLPVLIWS